MLEFISTLADVKTLLGIGSLFALSGTGAIPKIGLGRAIILAFSSRFSSLPVKSVRKTVMEKILKNLKTQPRGKYLVVTGPKGVGKSCSIATALNRQYGVVTISVSYSFLSNSK